MKLTSRDNIICTQFLIDEENNILYTFLSNFIL